MEVAGAARFGHGDHDGIFVDIEAHAALNPVHVLVFFLRGLG